MEIARGAGGETRSYGNAFFNALPFVEFFFGKRVCVIQIFGGHNLVLRFYRTLYHAVDIATVFDILKPTCGKITERFAVFADDDVV